MRFQMYYCTTISSKDLSSVWFSSRLIRMLSDVQCVSQLVLFSDYSYVNELRYDWLTTSVSHRCLTSDLYAVTTEALRLSTSKSFFSKSKEQAVFHHMSPLYIYFVLLLDCLSELCCGRKSTLAVLIILINLVCDCRRPSCWKSPSSRIREMGDLPRCQR